MSKLTMNINPELLTRVHNYVLISKEYQDLLQNAGKTSDSKLLKLSLNVFLLNTIKDKLDRVEPKKVLPKEV